MSEWRWRAIQRAISALLVASGMHMGMPMRGLPRGRFLVLPARREVRSD